MDWNTLLSVAIGGCIAIIPVVISNRFHAKERGKERQEQRQLAKVLSREKWYERDILKIMDFVEELLGLYSEIDNIRSNAHAFEDSNNLSKFAKRLRARAEKTPFLEKDVDLIVTKIHTYVLSFDDDELTTRLREFIKASYKLTRKQSELMKNEIYGESVHEGELSDIWFEVFIYAGKFHQTLREKLTSLRN